MKESLLKQNLFDQFRLVLSMIIEEGGVIGSLSKHMCDKLIHKLNTHNIKVNDFIDEAFTWNKNINMIRSNNIDKYISAKMELYYYCNFLKEELGNGKCS